MAEQECRFYHRALKENKKFEVERMFNRPHVVLRKERAEVCLGGMKNLTL